MANTAYKGKTIIEIIGLNPGDAEYVEGERKVTVVFEDGMRETINAAELDGNDGHASKKTGSDLANQAKKETDRANKAGNEGQFTSVGQGLNRDQTRPVNRP